MLQLYWNTVVGLLREVLERTMRAPEFEAFRLVGGTSLSLQIGHRLSVDIDLFTDASYGSIDFEAINRFFKKNYPYVQTNSGQVGVGTSYFVGMNEQNAIKIDLYYTDRFIQPTLLKEGIRLATPEEILAMKVEVISRCGRKKDFWDIHAFINEYSLDAMLRLHEQRYPYGHDPALIRQKVLDFDEADNDFDPNCLEGKHWELIKYDLVHWVNPPG